MPFEPGSAGTSIDRVERSIGDEPAPVEIDRRMKAIQHHLLDIRILYDECPRYIGNVPDRPSIDISHPPDSRQMGAVKNLMRREFFRQVRGKMKQQWRREFREMPNISYDFYESRLFAINEIGREGDSRDGVAGDYYSSSVREEVFDRDRGAEEDIPVVKLGPLVLMDSGSLGVDPALIGRIMGQKNRGGNAVEVGPEKLPLVSGRNYRLRTRFRFDVNPLKGFGGRPLNAIRAYGAVLEVDWLSDILQRERFTTECEAQYRGNEFAFLFNFVLKTW